MTKNQIKRIMQGMGYSIDEFERMPEIRAIIMSTNHGLNHHEQMVKLDSVNNMLRIKKYNYRVISGRFSNLVEVSDTLITTKSTLYLRNNIFPFRAPKVGDILLVVKRDGTIVGRTKIKNVGSLFIESEHPLSIFDKTQHTLLYADPENFENSIADKELPLVYFTYTPVSNNNTDFYLDSSDIIGFEMKSALLGSV